MAEIDKIVNFNMRARKLENFAKSAKFVAEGRPIFRCSFKTWKNAILKFLFYFLHA